GVEYAMTVDALSAGLRFEEVALSLRHRATGRDLPGFLHRGRQLLDVLLASGAQGVNQRGLRLPLVGGAAALAALAARRPNAQASFENFRVVPPGRGIVHQVNLEYLASVVHRRANDDDMVVYPDSLVGTDSHTTMINGL